MKNKDLIISLFNKIKKGHQYWVKGDQVFKERLERAFEPVFKELESQGVEHSFSEALLFFGEEFVNKERGGFNGSKEATVEEAEAIFGGKVVEMSDRQLRVAKLAQKHGVLVYREVPTSGDGVKIEVLAYKGKGKS